MNKAQFKKLLKTLLTNPKTQDQIIDLMAGSFEGAVMLTNTLNGFEVKLGENGPTYLLEITES